MDRREGRQGRDGETVHYPLIKLLLVLRSPLAMPKRLDPKLDVVFKILFAAQQNRDLLISLLTAVLRPSSPIVTVEVLNPEMPKELVTDKGSILDLRLKLADGRLIDVEMQANQQEGLRNRALFYWARMYSAQLGPGMGYDELQPCVTIFIMGQSELPSSRFHSTFELLEVHSSERFSDQLTVHFVELRKLPARSTTSSGESLLEDWGRFLSARSDQELQETAMSNPVIAKAMDALDFLSAQPRVQELARQRELALAQYLTDQRGWTAKGRVEGLADGLAKGEKKGRAKGEKKGRVEGEKKGRVEGRVAALLAVLQARGLCLSDDERGHLNACADLATLDRWIARAATAPTVAEVIAQE